MNERQLELEEKAQKEEAEKMDAMKALENRIEESKNEMDAYDALDTIQAQQRKTMNLDPEEALSIVRNREEKQTKLEQEVKVEKDEEDDKELEEALRQKQEEALKKEDERIKNLFSKPSSQVPSNNKGSNVLQVVPKKKKKAKRATVSLVPY